MQAPRRPRELGEVRHRVRPRSHQVHLAAQDVDELGQLVEPIPSQPPSQARDAIAIVALPLGAGSLDGVHGAELDEREGPPAAADALLKEEDGTSGIELDGERDDGEQRQADEQPERPQPQAELPREGQAHARGLEVVGEHDAPGRERFEGELAGQALVGLDGAFDKDPARSGFEQEADRQLRPSAEPDDDSAGPISSTTLRASGLVPRISRRLPPCCRLRTP